MKRSVLENDANFKPKFNIHVGAFLSDVSEYYCNVLCKLETYLF